MRKFDLRKASVGIVGVLALALGGLWLLQGLGLVHLKPILCFADCAEIQEASMAWAFVGLITAAAGTCGLVYSLEAATCGRALVVLDGSIHGTSATGGNQSGTAYDQEQR